MEYFIYLLNEGSIQRKTYSLKQKTFFYLPCHKYRNFSYYVVISVNRLIIAYRDRTQ